MRGRKTENGLSLLGGALLGAAAMYLLDPQTGRRRREYLGEVTGEALRGTGEYLGTAVERTREAARGWSEAAAQKAADVRHANSGLLGRFTERVRGFGHSIAETASDAASGTRDAVSRGASRAGEALSTPREWFTREEEESHAGTYAATGISTLLLGAAAMYLLDPQRGRQRRALLTDKATKIVNRTGRTFRQVGKDFGNRARGMAHETRGMVAGRFRHEEPVSADQLLQRVRSEMGHVVSHPAAIQVMTDNAGTVTLHGRVLASEVDKLVSTVRGVPGVEEVVNLLSVQETVEGVANYNAGGTGSAGSETGAFSGTTSGGAAPQM